MSLILPTDLVFPLTVDAGDELTAYTVVEDKEQPITFIACYQHTFHAPGPVAVHLGMAWAGNYKGFLQSDGMRFEEFSDRQNKAADPYLRYEGMELKTFRLEADCTFQAYDLDDAKNLLALHFAGEDPCCDLHSPNAPLEFVGEIELGAERDSPEPAADQPGLNGN